MKKTMRYTAIFLFYVAVIAIIYSGSRPLTYDLNVGDTSPYDIVAPRGAVDLTKTQQRAEEARALVAPTMMRSEKVSDNVLARVHQALTLIGAKRDELYYPTSAAGSPEGEDEEAAEPLEMQPRRTPSDAEIQLAVSSLISNLDQNMLLTFQANDVHTMILMTPSRFAAFRDEIESQAQLIMGGAVDSAGLSNAITQAEQDILEQYEYYQEDAELCGRVLRVMLTTNVIYNAEATENARQAAYDRVINNPVMINRGTRIVTQGDVITAETMDVLRALDLTSDSRFDGKALAGIALLVSFLMLITVFYFRRYQRNFFDTLRNFFALAVALIIPLLVTVAVAHTVPLAAPIHFAAVVICAYFGFRTSLFMSITLLLATLPIVSFEPAYAVIGLSAAVVAALFTRGIGRHDNYAKIILGTSGSALALTVAFGLMQKQAWTLIALQSAETTISAMVSVIAAIGIMPLFELIFNTVSPLRLIELSQPGHELLKRLFIEAPGTSQHSIMVANLADAAAEAVGANAMIARVGAYYHDIGKLENPLMFAENQKGENPHDTLTPDESTAIIVRHPTDGIRIARRYRLPQPILRIIEEHHGSTVLQYFYHRAQEEAEMKGEGAPDSEAFRYKTPVPASRESAIVMLADSTEAAMKSAAIDSLQEAENTIRQVVKNKIEQDQLVNSQLSFHDVEAIIQAFLQIYAGHFHERIAYPDDNKRS